MKPLQRSVGIGIDHIETVGGRHRYIRHMVSHQDRMAKVKPVISLEPPTASFGGGKYRTPQASRLSGKSSTLTRETFSEVREAFRRVKEIHAGGRRSTLQTKQPGWQQKLAQKISRNRQMGSRQYMLEQAHATELYHQRRRIASSGSLAERRKNKLDPEVYPVRILTHARQGSAVEVLNLEALHRTGHVPPMPHSARGTTATRPLTATTNDTAAAGDGTAAVAAVAKATGTAAAVGGAGGAGSVSRVRPTTAGARVAAPSARPASARPASARPAVSFGDVSLGKPSCDVSVLRRGILEQIVSRRLFRGTELKPFLTAVIRGNKHLDANLLKEAVRDVERDFFLV